MAMVFLIFYLLALGVIVAGAPRALLEAIFSCNLFGTVTHVKDDTGKIDSPSASSKEDEDKTATGVEDVDGFFNKSPVKQPPEEMEMQVFSGTGDLEETIEQSTSMSPKPCDTYPDTHRRSSSTLTRTLTKGLSVIGRQHTSASESVASSKPSVLDVLTGRHHDVRDRSASITRRETTSSVGSNRSRTLSWEEKRDQFARSKTLDNRDRPQASQLRHTQSIVLADRRFRRPLRTTSSSEGDKESVQSPNVTKSLPIGIPYNPASATSSPPPSSPTRSYLNPTPLDPIIEVSTLPRPPKDSKKEPVTSPETLVEEEPRQPSPPPGQPSPPLEESLVTNRPSSPSKQEFPGVGPAKPSVPHPLSLSLRQHSYSESVMEDPGHRDPSKGDRVRANSYSQVR